MGDPTPCEDKPQSHLNFAPGWKLLAEFDCTGAANSGVFGKENVTACVDHRLSEGCSANFMGTRDLFRHCFTGMQAFCPKTCHCVMSGQDDCPKRCGTTTSKTVAYS